MDPFDILLNFTIPGDETVYSVSFGDLDAQNTISMQYVAVYSTAIAASISFFFLLLVYTRKITPMYLLNQSILVALILRSSLFIAFQMSPISSFATTFTGIPRPGTVGQIKISIASNAFQVILITLIQVSFTYQVYTIFKSSNGIIGPILTAFCGALSCVVFGLYVNNTVYTTRVYNRMFYDSTPLVQGSWVTDLPFIMFSVSINITSVILMAKLILAIRSRRYLGLKQFSSYHILTITLSQTMIVPSILVIINYALSHRFREINLLSSLSPILVSLSLPFSSIWASTANNTRNLSSSVLRMLKNEENSATDDNTLSGDIPSMLPAKLVKFDDDVSLDESPDTIGKSFFGPDADMPNDMKDLLDDGSPHSPGFKFQ